MAEPLSIAAGVIAVIQIANSITKLCKFYIENAGDATTDLRSILLETSTLKTVMKTLNFLATCETAKSTLIEDLSRKDGPIEGCRHAIIGLESLLQVDSEHSPSKDRSKKHKVKVTFAALAWPLKANKAKRLLDEITRYKSTIMLAITSDSV